ncbi:MAG: type II toxin-antitoxin system Phd/YefM family antitoxin [Magnetococcales bacterium]|nr:type II toxin-antitoxin system Phd/YefM family antitoxin [Magnetococcales bacterium]
MSKRLSKSQFKPRALEWFRQVEEKGEELIITHRGKPVLKIVPYGEEKMEEEADPLAFFRNSVIEYKDPLEPVGLEDWEALK